MNVLILMVDEMAAWAIGSGVRTPNIDRLAARGVTYEAAYTPSPICVPARAAIATGKYVYETGNWSSAEAYDGRVPGWAHQVRDAGFEAVSIGKLHYKNGSLDTGFERQIEPIHIPGGEGWVRGLLRKPLCDYAPTAEMAQQIGPGHTAYHDFDRRVAREACEWLSDPARRARPWCAFVSFLSPHYPLIAPPEEYAQYDPAADAQAPEPVPDHPILQEMAGFFDHDAHFDADTRGIARASYRALCSFVDRLVGQVVDALEASGQAEDTLVLFTSDHGDMLGQHGFWAKSVMYEASARVPLIICGPGITPGRRDDPVSLIDIAPTVAQAMGLEVGAYTGRSLLAAPQDDSRTVLSEYHDGGASVGLTMVRWDDGGGRWKYVHYAEGYPPQLFELTADPQEAHNLASERPDQVAQARRRLSVWMDPEEVNLRAHADQALVIEQLGGRDALLAREQWNFTPADSR